MFPGLPSRLEKEIKQLYLSKVLDGNPERLNVSRLEFFHRKNFIDFHGTIAEIPAQN